MLQTWGRWQTGGRYSKHSQAAYTGQDADKGQSIVADEGKVAVKGAGTLIEKLFLPTGGVKMFLYLSLTCL